MPRYIDAEKLAEHKFPCATYDRYVSDGKWKSEEEIYAYKVGYNVAIEDIAQFAPTADVVEQKRGRWETKPCLDPYEDSVEVRRCSVCKTKLKVYSSWHFNYCPNCGARME